MRDRLQVRPRCSWPRAIEIHVRGGNAQGSHPTHKVRSAPLCRTSEKCSRADPRSRAASELFVAGLDLTGLAAALPSTNPTGPAIADWIKYPPGTSRAVSSHHLSSSQPPRYLRHRRDACRNRATPAPRSPCGLHQQAIPPPRRRLRRCTRAPAVWLARSLV